MNEYGLAFAAIAFLGNWLLSPKIVSGRTYIDGFFYGLISGIVLLILFEIFKKIAG